MQNNIINEICSLAPMRVQDIYGLFHTVLILELYSKTQGRLYLVFDSSTQTSSLHLQKERPRGEKSSSSLILMLKKYALGRPLFF